MPEISTVIITNNNEKNIERCLTSVKPVSEEIIVVDSYSADATPEICKKHPEVKFYQKELTSAGDQKNYGISKTSNDYIFSIDANEELSPGLLNHLAVNREQFTKFAYAFRTLNHIGSEAIEHGLWYPNERIRLFRKDKGLWETGVLRERVLPEPGVKPVKIPLHINRYEFSTIQEFRRDSEEYARWWAEHKLEAGEKAGALSAIFRATLTFLRSFFIKLAFLDGITGVQVSVQNTRETYLKYKALRLQNKHG
ncbi:glycosyltransferase family 2 protein [Saccharicrinis sp. FJH62]|uniref:glycosyltransferase family 2 protein n=1 Tax=Saccharicrinis sp. FJH62 TaxID=3344657 RepID=UPI0035D40E11